MGIVRLCVPFERKEEARRAGARWQREERVWACDAALLATEAYRQLRPFVPRMYRPEIEPPYIRPWMVPQTLWGRNLRALLTKEQWDIVRRHAYEQAGKRCRVCGGRGPQWPVEADEAWEYDDATRIQTLKGVIALCPDCHHVRHWGKTMADGREEEAFRHLMAVNRWSRAQAEQAVEAALEQWEQRSRHQWASDYGWVTRVHGFVPDAAGAMRADAANRELVSAAARRADELDQPVRGPAIAPERTASGKGVSRGAAEPSERSRRSIVEALKSLFR